MKSKRNHEDPPDLGSVKGRLRYTAKRAGLSSGVIADRLNVTGAAVRKWWLGDNEPPIDSLIRYAEIVGCSVGYLVSGQPDATEVIAAFNEARRQWAAAVAHGEDAAAAWERLLGREDLFRPEDRARLSASSSELARFLVSVDGVEWIELKAEAHRVIRDLVHLLAERSAQ